MGAGAFWESVCEGRLSGRGGGKKKRWHDPSLAQGKPFATQGDKPALHGGMQRLGARVDLKREEPIGRSAFPGDPRERRAA